MASAEGARAEEALRVRHRDKWPRISYVYDADEHRRTTGRKLLLESPAGQVVLAAEYKGVDEGELDLRDLQFRMVAESVADGLPAFAVQFTHPLLSPPQPWAFRLWPLNELATKLAPVELSEQRYVQFQYVLQRGATAGGGVDLSNQATLTDGVTFARWEELQHLDDELPPERAWPKVIETDPRQTPRLRTIQNLLTAQAFVQRYGREVKSLLPRASVSNLVLRRPALGAFRQRREPREEPLTQEPLISVPELNWRTQAVLDRWDRERYKLDRTYKALWAAESASDDNRDMWRAYDPDGSRRWTGT